MKSRKKAAKSSTAGAIEIPRALPLPATSGTGREIPGDRDPPRFPTTPASETPSSKADKNPRRKPTNKKQKPPTKRRPPPAASPRPQDADLLAHAGPAEKGRQAAAREKSAQTSIKSAQSAFRPPDAWRRRRAPSKKPSPILNNLGRRLCLGAGPSSRRGGVIIKSSRRTRPRMRGRLDRR